MSTSLRAGIVGLLILALAWTSGPWPAAAARRAPRRSPPARVVLVEKDVNLDESLRLARALRAAGIETVLTRSTDAFVPLAERSEVVRRADAQILLSVHNNASRNSRVRGTEVYHQRGSSLGAALARRVLAGIVARTSTSSRGALTRAGHDGDDYYAVLRNTPATALIIEGAYLSNPSEARLLADPGFRQRLADGITDGLVKQMAVPVRTGAGPGPPASGPTGPILLAPTGLSTTRWGNLGAALRWDPVAGATSYRIWRDGVLVGGVAAVDHLGVSVTPGQPAFVDADAGPGTHHYEVRARTELAAAAPTLGPTVAESPSSVGQVTIPWRVVVDPGHGGRDPGAIGRF